MTRQVPDTLPRPTRPRSWCRAAKPKRSPFSMTMTVALGTSTPTSTTVVETSHVDLTALEGIDHAVLLPRRHAAMKALNGKSRQGQTQSFELGCRIVQRYRHGHAALAVAGDTGYVFQLIGRVTRLHKRADHVSC